MAAENLGWGLEGIRNHSQLGEDTSANLGSLPLSRWKKTHGFVQEWVPKNLKVDHLIIISPGLSDHFDLYIPVAGQTQMPHQITSDTPTLGDDQLHINLGCLQLFIPSGHVQFRKDLMSSMASDSLFLS